MQASIPSKSGTMIRFNDPPEFSMESNVETVLPDRCRYLPGEQGASPL
jgi:hypothetical protein